MLARQVAVETVAQAIDHGRIGLQHHRHLQPPHEHAGDARALRGLASFLLDDGRERQHLVRRAERQLRITFGPACSQSLLHGAIGAFQHIDVFLAAHERIGLGQETSFRMHAFRTDARHHVGVGQTAQRRFEFRFLRQGETQLLETPALDDGELVMDHVAVGHASQQATRAHVLGQRVFACMQPVEHAHLVRQNAPVPPGRVVAGRGLDLAHDARERGAEFHVQHQLVCA